MSEVGHIQHACPILGLADDPETSQAFPSPWNCCHRSHPIASVNLSHQRKYCLADKHVDCPVFLRQEREPLPDLLRGFHLTLKQNQEVLLRRLVIGSIAGFALFTLILGILGLTIPPYNNMTVTDKARQQKTPVPSITLKVMTVVPRFSRTSERLGNIGGITPSPTQTLSQTPTLTFTSTRTSTLTNTSTRTSTLTNTPTRTPTPSHTLTSTLMPTLTTRPSTRQLDMLIGTDRKFVLHKLRGGETFDQYAEKYNTSVKAILAVNHDLRSPLWIGDVVIIPYGFTDVTGLPSFEPYLITDPDRSLDSLAEEFHVAHSDLKYFNGMSDGEILLKGDWLLIPRASPGQ